MRYFWRYTASRMVDIVDRSQGLVAMEIIDFSLGLLEILISKLFPLK